MILKGSQRAGAGHLAAHLLRADDNDHVEVHELRGFVADDLRGALQEAHAVSKGTRCKQFLFSLSLNPPLTAAVSDRDFKDAIRMVEQQLGLVGQPRAIVFHEKEGRRHAHCVWSRIDGETMKAINLPHFKLKLRQVSRELFIRNDWRMPGGLVDSRARDPANFGREEWQQAKRTGVDPRAVKETFRECWAASDSAAAFAHALEERGFWLARGDQRAFVAVDFRGEVYGVARYSGQKTKAVAERLGDPQAMPSVEQVKARIAGRMTAAVRGMIREAEQAQIVRNGELALRKRDMVRRQRLDRQSLKEQHEARWTRETVARAARLRRGLLGLWDRILGRHGKTRRENERAAYESYMRDQAEKQALIRKQLAERQTLQREIVAARQAHGEELKALQRDVARYVRMNADSRRHVQEQFRQAVRPRKTAVKIEPQNAADKRRGGGRRRKRSDGISE